MKTIIYRQINITNKSVEFENIENLLKEGFFLLGIELTDPELANKCHMSIDPQHDQTNKTKITSIEYAFNYRDEVLSLLSPFDNIFMGTVKPDSDSIGTMAILTMMLTHKFHLDSDIVLRLKAIANSDRHGRENWNERKKDYFHFENYNTFGLPSGLAYMTSDHKLRTEEKVQNMIKYLLDGSFPGIEKYADRVAKNLKKSHKNTTCNVIIPKKLCHVESSHRGAVAFGYRQTPVVIASNPSFKFGKANTKITGMKVTIAQYEDNKHIDLIRLTDELNSIEPGWGGSSTIIGSPLEKPTKMKLDDIINITKKYLI